MVTALAAYDFLTAGRTRFVRVDELCRLAAEKYPSLLPSREALARRAPFLPKEKKGLEKQQGEFLAEVLADPACGAHLCHAMLLPRMESTPLLDSYVKKGEADLGGAHVRREGKASFVTMHNPRHLNAEDETTLGPLETAIDLALLDPQSQICVLRGDVVTNAKYAGRRLFGAGINLTHLYQGKIRYLWYILRALGLVTNPYRGVALPDASPEVRSIEKPWSAAVEGVASGGHCQILLAVDYTLA